MNDPLVAIIDGAVAGEIHRSRTGRLRLFYDADWRAREDAYPLSLSMPLIAAEHAHGSIEPWLWGLLPDSELTLQRWGQRFHISPRNVFALLGAVGEDCAGAVQFATPERAAALLEPVEGTVEWLAHGDVAMRLAALRADQSAGRAPGDAGQFSLAGAQPKTALLFDGERWGVPAGRTPTTHILKPPLGNFDGHAENEHLCLELARAFGLPAANSQVRRFGDEVAIVVERYDRRRTADGIRRLHQEDLCQAIGLPPTMKYQNEGGPDVGQMLNAIRTHSSAAQEDAWTFARALMLNWLIGGTDAHAKNFSLLIGAGGRARLAPLYDMASALPYVPDPRKLKLANKIGGEYRLADIGLRQWTKLAAEARLPSADVLAVCREMADILPGHIGAVAMQARDEGLDHPIVGRMVEALSDHAGHCGKMLAAGAG